MASEHHPTIPRSGARTLADEINIATRQLHTHLNRLITARLPLCLPPHTSDPRVYASGLLHFAHVYFTFESLWLDIVKDQPTSPSDTESASPSQNAPASTTDLDPTATSTSPSISPRVSLLLSSLFDPGLLRSSSLRADLHNTLDLSPDLLEIALTQAPSPVVADYISHIRTTVQARPHVLLAYFWTMYMALFAGGRWIRGQLRSGLWPTAGLLSDEKSACVPGISFFCFPGVLDGEDIKVAFKAGFVLKSAELLNAQEKAEIVDEARTVFRFSTLMVEELDRVVGGQQAQNTSVLPAGTASVEPAGNKSVPRAGSATLDEHTQKSALNLDPTKAPGGAVSVSRSPSTFIQSQPHLAALLTLVVGLSGLFFYFFIVSF
ncbi:heme oxygenase-like protein [Xylona heveae TC161]|uniref:Heme oxygenase-like protein n=1 Tax=Xylona heveae (strain CBS 132557 / TC161) TaxID=1328760 RepID=A0A165JRZ0_XYLHT|nr:heme oxygenase-like protein [Xylona heveae TC161]KZF26554.1 heme oxygenase-like protein [Xylona heveae TC161]